MAFILGLVISTPLELKLFEKEIKCFYKPTNEFYLNGVHYIEINNH